jgi:preprotein translocase subunit YajC
LSLLDILGQTSTTGPTAPTSQPAPAWFEFLRGTGPIILIVIVFYFLFIRSKRNTDKQRRSMLDNLKKGDEVVTIGGEIGKVVESRPDRVLLKVDETSNAKVWYLRSAIHRVLEEDKSDAK